MELAPKQVDHIRGGAGKCFFIFQALLFQELWNCCRSEEWEQVSHLEVLQVKKKILVMWDLSGKPP